jgi:hypothetical protein
MLMRNSARSLMPLRAIYFDSFDFRILLFANYQLGSLVARLTPTVVQVEVLAS